jgi:hypothetical protein
VTKLYVGNLPFTATDEAVRALFAQHGSVEKVSLITDRETGRPRGFGFVEMSGAVRWWQSRGRRAPLLTIDQQRTRI